MTIHRTGVLVPAADALRTTHQGVEIALQMVDWGNGASPLLLLLERSGSAWLNVAAVYEFDDDNTGVGGYGFAVQAAKLGAGNVGLIAWIKTVLVPKINEALAARFKPTGAATPPAPAGTGDPLVALDNLLRSTIKWAPQPDGTLKVTA